ncbi:MAG TPA: amino acid adenylation domain-containing protein [Gaiellaceae bacterium]|nr:amino acid adenylation domain-containing protein [Gaiellaceae bacterium]
MFEFVDQFLATARAQPERCAVVDATRSFTYGELLARGESIAAALIDRGISEDDPVVVCCERGVSAIAAIVGIALSGGVYVPIDPSEPPARLQLILSCADPNAGLVDGAGNRVLEGAIETLLEIDEVDACSLSDSRLGHLAYLLFTSGSTGTPKGVEVTRANLNAFLRGSEKWSEAEAQERWACYHSFTFDISIWEIWGALTNGGTLFVIPAMAQLDAELLISWLETYKIERLCQTPTAVRQLLAATTNITRLDALRALYICGERLDFATLKPLLPFVKRDTMSIFNLYGPTEATIYATGRRLTIRDIASERRSLIGVPLPHVCAEVRRSDGTLAEPGETAELVLRGDGIARGYRRERTLTALQFRQGKDGICEYITGDLVRAANEGLEFIGRKSGFVKIRGYRVEPEEVASALRRHAAVEDAVVVDLELAGSGVALVAAVTLQPGATVGARELRLFVATLLPAYMRPARIFLFDALPRLASSKIDQKGIRLLLEQCLQTTTVAAG